MTARQMLYLALLLLLGCCTATCPVMVDVDRTRATPSDDWLVTVKCQGELLKAKRCKDGARIKGSTLLCDGRPLVYLPQDVTVIQ